MTDPEVELILFSLNIILLSLALPWPTPDDDLPPGILAQGKRFEVTEAELYRHMSSRYAHDVLGKTLLDQILREAALREEASKRGIEVGKINAESKIEELERRCRAASGGEMGLDGYIKENGISPETFMEMLKLSIAHEMMARKDFEVPDGEGIPSEKLNVWLNEKLGKTSVETEGLPEHVVVRVAGKEISDVEFGKRLMDMLSKAKATEHLNELIGARLVALAAQALGVEVTEKDLKIEIAQREARLQARPGLGAVTYDSYLQAATGQTVSEFMHSERFRTEVLLAKVCAVHHHEAYLQDFFAKNRDFFMARYGRAARVSVIFLAAIQFENELNKKGKVTRRFEEARAELEAFRTRIAQGETTFENLARIYSEHDSKAKGGDMGFLPAAQPGWADVAKSAVEAEMGTVLGPFDMPEGCYLVKVTGKRNDPTYKEIKDRVIIEARQRYYHELLLKSEVKRAF